MGDRGATRLGPANPRCEHGDALEGGCCLGRGARVESREAEAEQGFSQQSIVLRALEGGDGLGVVLGRDRGLASGRLELGDREM